MKEPNKWKKVMLIGKVGSGKTTLIQRMTGEPLAYKKTQTLDVRYNFIDTPGEYLENRRFYRALIVSAVEADCIVLIEDCTSEAVWLPIGFSSAFNKDVIGLVTKTDLAQSEKQIQLAEQKLKDAGASKIFYISALSGDGIDTLANYFEKT